METAKKLEEAREALGHTISQACAEIGCSQASWYAWQKGAPPGPMALRGVEAYIARAAEKAGRGE